MSGIRFGADLDARVLIESLSGIDKKMEELNKRMRLYLHHPRANTRDLYKNADVPATAIGPILIDLGTVPPGLQWDVKQVSVFPNDTFTTVPVGAAAFSAMGSSTNPGANGVIVSTPTATWPPGSYQVTANAWYGAIAGTANDMKVVISGVSTITTLGVIAVANAGPITRTMVAVVNQPTNIQVQAIAGVAGNYNASLDVTPIPNNVIAAVYKGIPPSPDRLTTGNPTNFMDCIAPRLPIPFVQQFGGKIAVMRGNQHLYVLVNAPGAALQPSSFGINAFTSIYATASVVETVDTEEAVTWL